MKNVIKIEGVEYPCVMTMGTMLEFKNRTNKEVTELTGNDLSLVIVLLFCCVLSSCRAAGITFPFKTEMEMADHMAPEDLTAWQNGNFSEVIEGDPSMALEKKKE